MILIRGNVERIVTDPAQIETMKADGYNALGETACESDVESPKHVDGMNLSELRSLAKEKGLSGYSSLNKEELVAVLKEVI